MKSLSLLCATFVAGLAGCSLPMIGGGSSHETPAEFAAAADDGAAPPVVQVRGYRRSSVVSVVAWDADESDFGLRTSVSRTGKLVGGLRYGDHSLYLSPFFARKMGGFAHAAVMPAGQLLLGTGTRRDSYSCFYGRSCSPMVTVAVRVPDSLLRANRDSLVVTFFPRTLDPWTITLRRELIAAYLQKVDSVVAEMNKIASM